MKKRHKIYAIRVYFSLLLISKTNIEMCESDSIGKTRQDNDSWYSSRFNLNPPIVIPCWTIILLFIAIVLRDSFLLIVSIEHSLNIRRSSPHRLQRTSHGSVQLGYCVSIGVFLFAFLLSLLRVIAFLIDLQVNIYQPVKGLHSRNKKNG